MKSPLNSIKKQYHEIVDDLASLPTWLKIGSYAIMLVGPQTDPTIAASDKEMILNATLAVGAAIMVKKADNHRRIRHKDVVDERIQTNAQNRLQLADDQSKDKQLTAPQSPVET